MRATEVYILFMGRLDREVTSAKEIYSSKNLKKKERRGHEKNSCKINKRKN